MLCYTIGHSKHAVEKFAALLKPYSINLVTDVRSTPYSRYAPQFNRDAAQRNLSPFGIEYKYMGDLLGGKNFDASLFQKILLRS
jgi:uncharacterized protein (DUF488 family)